MVRINQLPLGLEDLEMLVPESPDLVLIPKVEDPRQVLQVQAQIEQVQHESGGSDPIWLMPILESALGIENAFAIAKATDTVVAVTIGLEDYTADLGVAKTAEGAESLYARMRLVNAARAAGVQAIDSVYGDVGDMPIHDSFAPSVAEIEKALRVVAAFEEAEAKGLGVVSLGTRMIDPPVVLRAQHIVALARQTGRLPEGVR
jgi:citrate lyase subunit beta/citryl-CoA lyase